MIFQLFFFPLALLLSFSLPFSPPFFTSRFVVFSFKVAGENGEMKEVSLMKYFYDKYGLKLEMKHLPALVIGSKKDNWVPMEVR